MSITEKSGFQQSRRNWNSRIKAWKRDKENRKVYGPHAPLFAERLWVPMDQLNFALKFWSSKQSGNVVYEWPTQRITPINKIEVISACRRHWHENIPWEETGIYQKITDYIKQRGKIDRLKSREDIEVRYRELDELYKSVMKTRNLSIRSDLIKNNFREEGGILIHIGPDGMPYFGGKGHHRLAVAIAAGIKKIPAQIGVIHLDGLPKLQMYRA